MTALPPAVAVGVAFVVAGAFAIVVMILVVDGEREKQLKRQLCIWGAE